jgi:hypothetical protein
MIDNYKNFNESQDWTHTLAEKAKELLIAEATGA